VRTALASSTSFGRSSLLALGIPDESSFLRAACARVRRHLAALAIHGEQVVEVEREALFLMAARTWSAFWRMNWMSSMGASRGE